MQFVQNHRNIGQESLNKLNGSLLIQEELVKGFIATLGARPHEVRGNDLHQKAISYLAQSNTSVKDLFQLTKTYQDVLEKLKPIEQKAAMLRRNHNSMSSAEKDKYRGEIHGELVPLRIACDLTRDYRPNEIPALRVLQADIHQLQSIAASELSRINDRVQPHIRAFKELVKQSILNWSSQQVSLGKVEELKNLSSHYPRGLSPEAEACARGLLILPKDASQAQALLDKYVGAAKGNGGSPSDGSFFAELREKNNLLRMSPRDLALLQELRELYTQSGSDALAYFANLNCIAVGDTSHDTLFRTYRLASSLSLVNEFGQILANLPQSLQGNSVAFHLQRMLVSLGHEPQAAALTEALPVNSPEQVMIGHIKVQTNPSPFGKDAGVMRIRRTAQKEPQYTSLYVEAALLVQKLEQQEIKALVEAAPNDVRVVKRVLDPLLHGTPAWNSVEQTIKTLRADWSKAWIQAGEKAWQLGDAERAQGYFHEAYLACMKKTVKEQTSAEKSVLIEVSLGLAQIYEATDLNKVKKFLSAVETYAPNHPDLLGGLQAANASQSLSQSVSSQLVLPKISSITPPHWNEHIKEELYNACAGAGSSGQGIYASSTVRSAKVLLSPLGDLANQLEQASAQVRQQIEWVDQTIRKAPCKVSLWETNCGLIHRELSVGQPHGGFGFFASSLRGLCDILTDLDPDDDYFAPLQNYGRLETLASRAQSAWGVCSRCDPRTSRVQIKPLQDFRQSLVDISELINEDIAQSLGEGEKLLATWARDMEYILQTLKAA